VHRFCRGFRHVVVVLPRSSLARWTWSGLTADRVLCCPDYRDDYLGQQVTKLYADTWSDADFVCHVDSDCVFQRPTAPADLAIDGRPYVLMAPYARLDPHIPWRPLTEQFLGTPVAFEFMRHPPYTFPRGIYPAVRQHCRERHAMSLDDYVLGRPPRGFSEFNALAALAHRDHHTEFTWIDVTAQDAPPAPCRVFWSRQPPDVHTHREMRALLEA
jgi:hypothetical protein